MSNSKKEAGKQAKKMAKAKAKAAKKRAKLDQAASSAAAEHVPPSPGTVEDLSPAERSARAAEKKIVLERWRMVLAAIGTLIALLSLFLMYRGC